jgi:hypothetical protein
MKVESSWESEPVFINVYGAQESIPSPGIVSEPSNRFRGWESIPGPLKGLQIRAQVSLHYIKLKGIIYSYIQCVQNCMNFYMYCLRYVVYMLLYGLLQAFFFERDPHSRTEIGERDIVLSA